jgi:hypothetical protein
MTTTDLGVASRTSAPDGAGSTVAPTRRKGARRRLLVRRLTDRQSSVHQLSAVGLGLGLAALGVTAAVGMLDAAASGAGVPVMMWGAFRLAIAGVAILVAIGGLLSLVFGEAYLATLWITAARLPGLIAVAWLLAYLVPPAATVPAMTTLGIGLWFATLSWLLITAPFRRMAMVDTAQTQSYGELVVRYNQLRSRCEACSEGLGSWGPPPLGAAVGRAEAIKQLRLVREMLALPDDGLSSMTPAQRGPGAIAWATGTGYNTAWEALDRADEALIDAEAESAVIGEGLHDMLRLSGSTIKNADRLQDSLRAAVRHFDPDADRLYFYPQRRRMDDPLPPRGDAAPPGAAAATAESTAASPPARRAMDDAAARAVIREVRHAVSDYRDSRRAAIVRARNRLLRTILVTGIAADVLLGLVIVEHVEQGTLAAAAAFFLVGGVVGLYNRLRLEGNTGVATTPDYGLFDARLLHTILVSGLAAVGGVFLMSAAPVAGAVLGTNAQTAAPMALDQVFNPETNRLGFLVAAVFGLTPDLLIGKLRQQTDALKQDLSTSDAAVAGPATAAGGATT